MAPGHAASGALAGALTAPLVLQPVTPVSAAVWIGVCTIAALVCDLDHPNSRLTKALGPITWVINRLFVASAKVVFNATRGPADDQHTNGHRVLWHQVEPAAAVGALVWLGLSFTAANEWALLAGAGVFVGMCAHIAGDCCTTAGAPVSLVVVLLRLLLGCDERWRCWGIPHWMRFKAGGTIGEPLATAVLTTGAVAASVLLLPGAWSAVASLAR